MASLEEWLERNCTTLEKAVKQVPAGKDLPDLYIWGKGEELGLIDLPHLESKDATVAVFKSTLKKMDADRYAIILAAWYVLMEPEEDHSIAMEEGTGGRYKHRRKECYIVTVGDERRSLIATYDVERDYKQKITGLIRRDIGDGSGLTEGRYHNLLVPSPTMH